MVDLGAQVAASATGQRELVRITAQFGAEAAYMVHVQDNAEESVRRVLDVLPDCSLSYPLGSGAHIEVAITVDRDVRRAVIDVAGSSPQDALNDNAPLATCRLIVLYASARSWAATSR